MESATPTVPDADAIPLWLKLASSEAATWLLFALLFALMLLVVVLGVLLARYRSAWLTAVSMGSQEQRPDDSLEAGRKDREYEDLVQGIIGAYDLSDSDVVRAHVEKTLRGVGITVITPTLGEPFDFALHNGVSAVAPPSPDLGFHVAKVLRPGWQSASGVVRPADVEVFGEV
jgi:hypothetical protein